MPVKNYRKKKIKVVIEFDIIDNLFMGIRKLKPEKKLEMYKEIFENISFLYNHIPRGKKQIKVKTKFIDREK